MIISQPTRPCVVVQSGAAAQLKPPPSPWRITSRGDQIIMNFFHMISPHQALDGEGILATSNYGNAINRTVISDDTSFFGRGVSGVKFEFCHVESGYIGYREIDIQQFQNCQHLLFLH